MRSHGYSRLVAIEPLIPEGREFDQRADVAAVAVLRRLLDAIERNLEGAIADRDPEFLHDLRVAVRRSRSVQRQLGRVFPPAELQHARAEFRWIQAITGPSRDLDVYLLEFEDMRELVSEPMRPNLEPLREALQRRRDTARIRMVADLRSERFMTIATEWAALLERLPSTPEHDRPEAAQPIGRLVGRRIATVYGQMIERGEKIDERGSSKAFHDLRKRGKELRYLLELFGLPLYPSAAVRPMIKSLKALQNVLGRHQDREVQMATLGSLAVELPHRPPAALATEALIARLDDDKWSARGEFSERFAPFASSSQRALVRDTFG
jgi:CHAD domain-containing protein